MDSTRDPESGSSAWFEEDFQAYGTTLDLCAAMVWCYGREGVESGTLFDGTEGRFVRTVYSGVNPEEHAGVNLSADRALTERPREIWGEVLVRYHERWKIVSDDKTLFVLEDWRHAGGDEEVWRWSIHMRGQADWFGGPYHRLSSYSFPEGAPDQGAEVWDGRWHRLRFHFKMGSGETAGDGIYEVWWDDRLVESRHGIRTDSAPDAFFRTVGLGRNADPEPGTGVRDWGRLRLFVRNPGW
jgi:hypothetical protein